MIIDLLSSLLACLALYGFVRVILAKQKRKPRNLLRKMVNDKARIREHLSKGGLLSELEDVNFKQPI